MRLPSHSERCEVSVRERRCARSSKSSRADHGQSGVAVWESRNFNISGSSLSGQLTWFTSCAVGLHPLFVTGTEETAPGVGLFAGVAIHVAYGLQPLFGVPPADG